MARTLPRVLYVGGRGEVRNPRIRQTFEYGTRTLSEFGTQNKHISSNVDNLKPCSVCEIAATRQLSVSRCSLRVRYLGENEAYS